MTTEINYEDVKEGLELPPFEVTVTRTHIVKYAGAGGDFNPVHHDEEFATAIGLPSVFAMGLMQGGFLTKVLTDWAGPKAVRRYKIRFKSMVWPKDTLTCKAQVTKVYREKGQPLVDCRLSVVNQKGEAAIEGEAVLALPSRRS